MLRIPRLPLLAVPLLALPLLGQAPTSLLLLRAGDPGPKPGEVVHSIGALGRNHGSSWGVSVEYANGDRLRSCLFGSPWPDGLGGPLACESGLTGWSQHAYDESFSGTTYAVFGALVTHSSTPETRRTGLWMYAHAFARHSLLVVEGYPIHTRPGLRWGRIEQASRSIDPSSGYHSVPAWLAETIEVTSGRTHTRGLFQGIGKLPLIQSGDVPEGSTHPIDVPGLSDEYWVSRTSQHWSVLADTTADETSDGIVVVDGRVLTLGGLPAREGVVLCSSIGGEGERWSEFGHVVVNDAGDLLLGASTDRAGGRDQVLVFNQGIHLRTGQEVSAGTLAGPIQDVGMNSAGRPIVLWSVRAGSGLREVVIVDQRVVAKVGQAVDLDGDGSVDPAHRIADLRSVYLDDAQQVFFVAGVDVRGTRSTTDDVACLFRLQCDGP